MDNKLTLKELLNDETGKLKEYAEKRNINFEADRFFVAYLFFKDSGLDLVEEVFGKIGKNSG